MAIYDKIGSDFLKPGGGSLLEGYRRPPLLRAVTFIDRDVVHLEAVSLLFCKLIDQFSFLHMATRQGT